MKRFRPRCASLVRLFAAMLMGTAAAPGIAGNQGPGSGDPCVQAATNGTCQSGNAARLPEFAIENDRKGVFITQIGDGNRAVVTQQAPDAAALIAQAGNDNAVTLTQQGSAPHSAQIAQEGNANAVIADQNGQGRTSLLMAQQGNRNLVDVAQNETAAGAVTSAIISQTGDDNRILLTQDGSDNAATLSQDGNDNLIAATQTGIGKRLIWSQVGDGLSGIEVQQGSPLVEITQSNTGGVQFAPPAGQ